MSITPLLSLWLESFSTVPTQYFTCLFLSKSQTAFARCGRSVPFAISLGGEQGRRVGSTDERPAAVYQPDRALHRARSPTSRRSAAGRQVKDPLPSAAQRGKARPPKGDRGEQRPFFFHAAPREVRKAARGGLAPAKVWETVYQQLSRCAGCGNPPAEDASPGHLDVGVELSACNFRAADSRS